MTLAIDPCQSKAARNLLVGGLFCCDDSPRSVFECPVASDLHKPAAAAVVAVAVGFVTFSFSRHRLSNVSPKFLSPILVCLAVILAGPFASLGHGDETPLDSVPDFGSSTVDPPSDDDLVRDIQSNAIINQQCDVAHWGRQRSKYITWSQHSNRLVPVYTFGITLDAWRDRGSPYADPARLKQIYGEVPLRTFNPIATYHDQTDVYQLQQRAHQMGCNAIIMIIFDGMDWQTSRAAATFAKPCKCENPDHLAYNAGRGSGLSFMDYRQCATDFGLVVTSSIAGKATYNVDAQIAQPITQDNRGGYDVVRGGETPWREDSDLEYLMGNDRAVRHQVTDSAAAATSIFSGIKTYNGSINIAPDGQKVTPIARTLQRAGWKIGIVTSVPVSHATPAAVYANNVTRKDYQDIARDLIGLPSSSHRKKPLPGVDVLLGAGWGEGTEQEKLQGENMLPGNPYIHQSDIERVTGPPKTGSAGQTDSENSADAVKPDDESKPADAPERPRYVLGTRTEGVSGRQSITDAANLAIQTNRRLLGLYGVKRGHLPYRTADGDYDPTFDLIGSERYTPEDIHENPTLADMTEAALSVLEKSEKGFYLMVEAGDVDWANHANNIDNSIGAVISGDQAFDVVTQWVDRNQAWDRTAVIVTADHGHFLVVDDEAALSKAGQKAAASRSNSPPENDQ